MIVFDCVWLCLILQNLKFDCAIERKLAFWLCDCAKMGILIVRLCNCVWLCLIVLIVHDCVEYTERKYQTFVSFLAAKFHFKKTAVSFPKLTQTEMQYLVNLLDWTITTRIGIFRNILDIFLWCHLGWLLLLIFHIFRS